MPTPEPVEPKLAKSEASLGEKKAAKAGEAGNEKADKKELSPELQKRFYALIAENMKGKTGDVGKLNATDLAAKKLGKEIIAEELARVDLRNKVANEPRPQ